MLITTLWNEGKYFVFGQHVPWQLNHHVHINECIFKLLVSLHNHLPLYRKCNLIFFGLSWGVSGLAQNNGCWRHPWLIFKTSLALRTAVAQDPALSLLLSQISSDIRFGDRNLAILVCAHITDCLLRKEYSVTLIIMYWK